MGIFSPFTFSWDGVDYTISGDRTMGACETVEEIVTLGEVHEMVSDPRLAKITRISRAWGALLRYAGATVTDEQVYEGMFKGAKDESSRVVVALWSLLKLMVPPSAMAEAQSGNGNRQARRAATVLSKKRSKRPAARAS
jgi:hypothetical protein